MPTGHPGAGPEVHLYLASGETDLAALAAPQFLIEIEAIAAKKPAAPVKKPAKK